MASVISGIALVGRCQGQLAKPVLLRGKLSINFLLLTLNEKKLFSFYI